jgi:hypothetical protein
MIDPPTRLGAIYVLTTLLVVRDARHASPSSHSRTQLK